MKRILYRLLMRTAHRYGWHHMRTLNVQGDIHQWCNWCGIRHVKKIDTLDIKNWRPVEIRSVAGLHPENGRVRARCTPDSSTP
jgi:hypothetical protein